MIKNKKIAIVGFGKEGIAALNYLGRDDTVSVFDEKNESEFQKSDLEKAKHTFFSAEFPKGEKFDLIIRSPGVRPDNKLINQLKSQDTIVTTSTEIFFDECPCPIIGVTGTKGKGTTSTLIYEMLKKKYKDVYLAGNIGTPALEVLPKLNPESQIVLELSSFQLIDLKKSPHVAVVLMITSEHLDWHSSTAEYQNAKKAIVQNQTPSDFAVINTDFETSKGFSIHSKAKTLFFSTTEKTNGTYLKNDLIVSEIKSYEEICKTSDIFIPGKHNIQNVLAAVAVAKIESIENSNIQSVLKSFKGLPHRLQLVRELNGVKFYNDSFSTTPETAEAAIDAFADPKILILGGSSKNSDFAHMGAKIRDDKSIKAAILIGDEAEKIKQSIGGFSGTIKEGCNNMQEIVDCANQLAESGDIVILSPACASFDMFKNYQERGDQFVTVVGALK